MAAQIYTGIWVDWTRGRIQGATLTLSAQDGALLLAFLAFFVTLVGARSWRLVGFLSHQIMANGGAHDGLYYQRQHILRNASAPTDAVWQFLQQAWYWRRIVRKPWLRTLPWALFGAAYLALFATTSILSSWISDGASNHRLLLPKSCGFHVPVGNEDLQVLRSFENQEAATYTRQCYDRLERNSACNSLPVRALSWTNKTIDCPFAPSVCLDVPAFEMSTPRLDSHHHFGINAPPSNRIGYRRKTVCSPLVAYPDYAQYVEGAEARRMGWGDNVTIKYLYGPQRDIRAYTHLYNTDSFYMNMGYSVWAYANYPGDDQRNIWQPINALKGNRADIVLLLIISNSIINLERNDDPVFAANFEFEAGGSIRYLADQAVSPVACIDQYQVCNPRNNVCTPLEESRALRVNVDLPGLDLNSVQRATALRLAFLSTTKSFYDLIYTRTQSFLRAQDRVFSITQHPLPPNHWHTEMAALFSDSLSLLQHQVMGYPTGPSQPGNISVFTPWGENPDQLFPSMDLSPEVQSSMEAMCHRQRVRFTEGTLNFSVLGLGLLVGIGAFLIALSFILEPAVTFMQKRTAIGAKRARRWERDGALQVMRMLYESKGAGDWEGTTSTFPRTKTAEAFHYDSPYREEQTASMPNLEEAQSGRLNFEFKVKRKPLAETSVTNV